jgi:phosphoribulokinase
MMNRRVVVERLSKIRDIRNDVMHFHPDGISDGDLATLRQTVRSYSNFKKGSYARPLVQIDGASDWISLDASD